MNRICTIHVTNTKKRIQCLTGDNLREILQAKGYLLPVFCGGKGICGKCGVDIKGMGRMLACQVQVQEDMEITLLGQEAEEAYQILTKPLDIEKSDIENSKEESPHWTYKIAIDIGTTTLACSLIESETGKCVGSYTALNSQRVYGADVVSRIQAEREGKGRELQVCIQRDLREAIRSLLEQYGLHQGQLEQIGIAGNTAMLHLLRGYSCEGLCRYPFEPKQLGMEELPLGDVLEATTYDEDLPIDASLSNAPVTILPGMEAFVGADITAGVYACEMEKDKNSILIDMGTNGEIVLKVGEQYYSTSVAAGPAFEGGNILWGTGSVTGAIEGANMQSDGLHLTTIGNKTPVGICGTGLVEIVAELLDSRIIDETGKLSDTYFENGYPLAKTKDSRDIVLTQKDIRQFQMAKAAVCTGVEMLLEEAEISCEEVDTIYLAGGFGCYLDVRKAAKTGLIPWELKDKTKAIGNSALLGVEKYLTDIHGKESIENIRKNSVEVTLSLKETFQERYIENISFR